MIGPQSITPKMKHKSGRLLFVSYYDKFEILCRNCCVETSKLHFLFCCKFCVDVPCKQTYGNNFHIQDKNTDK